MQSLVFLSTLYRSEPLATWLLKVLDECARGPTISDHKKQHDRWYGGSEVTCWKPDTFLLVATFAASFVATFAETFAATFAATLVSFVLRAQVLYHVFIKMAESENEDNLVYLLLPASAHFELYRKNRI